MPRPLQRSPVRLHVRFIEQTYIICGDFRVRRQNA